MKKIKAPSNYAQGSLLLPEKLEMSSRKKPDYNLLY